jgi:hypothetical protein
MGSLKKQEADAWPADQYDYDENGQPIFGMQVSKHSSWFLPPPKGWRPPPPQIPENPRDMLPDLWAYGRLVFENLVQLFGRPADLITKHWLFGREARLCRDWIYNLENFVRCILIIAALTLDVVLPKRRADLAMRPVRAREERAKPDETGPSAWSVSLPVFPPERELRGRGQRKKKPPDQSTRDYADTLPLAKRMEALYRVLKHQERYARRLAFRLARLKDRNKRANCPRTLKLRAWDYPFDFYNRTKGQHAIKTKMTPAHYAASLKLAAWHNLAPG